MSKEVPRYDLFESDINEENPPPSKRSRKNTRNLRTATSNSFRSRDSLFIVAITENRSREIGMACMDLKNPNLLLSQYVDTHTFVHTISKLFIFDPAEVLVSTTTAGSDLSNLIKNKFPNANFTLIERQYFSESSGMLMLQRCVVPEYFSSFEIEYSTKYLALASAAALLKYVEHIQSVNFASHSLKLTVSSAHESIEMDSETVKHLEIIANKRTGGKEHSLFGELDFTKTKLGSRMLKSNLVQPSSDIAALEERLNAVEDLIQNDRIGLECSEILSLFVDMDQLLNSMQLVQIPTSPSMRESTSLIKSVIKMKHTLELLPKLEKALSGDRCRLLTAVRISLSQPSFTKLRERISQVFNEETAWFKGAAHQRNQLCFSVKAGISGLLDVARKTYLESTDDMQALLKNYQSRYGLSSLSINFSVKRGNHFSASMEEKLPPIFIQVSQQGKRLKCSTDEMIKINQRITASVQEILLMTSQVVDEVTHEARKCLGDIYKLCDAIGLLDMCISFANYSSNCSVSARPEFSKDGPMVIKQGRHPIMEKIHQIPFIPNDTFLSETCNFQIITGPNMSGKSTYIKQIALLNVMAFIGCFVPANYANFRLVDRIFTRLGTGDQIEANSSSFHREMVEMAFILSHVTDKSLVLIDELGRATSNRDGMTLGWAISEHLACNVKAHSLFVTHYTELVGLEDLYCNVKNYHMMMDSTQSRELRFLFQVGEGSVGDSDYGIMIASKAGFPQDLIQDAMEINKRYNQVTRDKKDQNREKYASERAIFDLAQVLLNLRNSTMEESSLRKYLSKIKQDYL